LALWGYPLSLGRNTNGVTVQGAEVPVHAGESRWAMAAKPLALNNQLISK
jgi:hypothetical protein